MQSTLNHRNADPHDVFMITPEVALAPRAEAENEPSPQTISSVLAAAAAPQVDTTFRATAVDSVRLPRDRGAFGKWATRTALVFVFALGSALAASAWKEHGDTARKIAAEWIPQFSLTSAPSESPPSENTGLAEPASAAVQTAATDQAPAQPVPSAQSAEASAPVAAVSTDPQPLQSMARDLAAMSQQIEQLRASLEQLKAGQEQIARDIAARTSEAKAAPAAAPVARPKTVAPPPARPHAAVTPPAPRPRASSHPTYPAYPTQAAAPPPSASPPLASESAYPPPPSEPRPATTADDGGPLVRPPMPLR